jgi:hypothetical protein
MSDKNNEPVPSPGRAPTDPRCKTCGDTGWVMAYDSIEPGISAPIGEPCPGCEGPDEKCEKHGALVCEECAEARGFREGVEAAGRYCDETSDIVGGGAWAARIRKLAEPEPASAPSRATTATPDPGSFEWAYDESVDILQAALDGLPEAEADLPMPRMARRAAAAIVRLRGAATDLGGVEVRGASTRCTGRCHCHAGADGVVHPPCCGDCAPGAPTLAVETPWKPKRVRIVVEAEGQPTLDLDLWDMTGVALYNQYPDSRNRTPRVLTLQVEWGR